MVICILSSWSGSWISRIHDRRVRYTHCLPATEQPRDERTRSLVFQCDPVAAAQLKQSAIDELIAATTESFQSLDRQQLNSVFLTWMQVIIKCMKVNGTTIISSPIWARKSCSDRDDSRWCSHAQLRPLWTLVSPLSKDHIKSDIYFRTEGV
jgi:hypothetical protein